MRKFLIVTLAVLAGAILTAVAVVAILFATYSGVPDRDGGRSMGILFIIGPFSAVIGGVIAGLVAYWRTTPKVQSQLAGARPLWRGILSWTLGGIATLCLAIAGVNFMMAGGVSDGLYALGFAAGFAGASRLAGRRVPVEGSG